MKIRTSTHDWHVLVITMILGGVVLAAISFTAFYDAARHDPGVTRFLLGYTLLWAAIMHWGQRRHDETLIKTGMMLGEMNAKVNAEQD
jgi:hypothetical protein